MSYVGSCSYGINIIKNCSPRGWLSGSAWLERGETVRGGCLARVVGVLGEKGKPCDLGGDLTQGIVSLPLL